jgi:hypothetical protein
MPKTSPFPIILTAQEARSLRKTARSYTSPYCEVTRAKTILLAADGLDNTRIGQRLDLPRQIVSKWRQRFFFERLAGLEDRPRRGRPCVFPPRRRRRDQGARLRDAD